MGYEWGDNAKIHPDDHTDFDLDLGCGTAKKGRIGVDKYDLPSVDVVVDLNESGLGSLFPEGSIDSIIASHILEHIGEGFVSLIDDCWRILSPGGLLRIIVPLFPTRAAVIDPDHKRFFVPGSFDYFTSSPPGNQQPYIDGTFIKTAEQWTPDNPDWGEMRVSLRKVQ